MSLINRQEESSQDAITAALVDSQNDRVECELTLKFHKLIMENSGLSPTESVMIDGWGDLIAGGWFVNPFSYQGRILATFGDVKREGILNGDYYEMKVRGNFSKATIQTLSD